MSDNEVDRHDTAFRQLFDGSSVVSSNVDDHVFPDIAVLYHVEAPSGLRAFKGKIDTGAKLCLMAERVVRERFGMERIDTTKWKTLDDLGKNGTRTLGQIRLKVLLGSRESSLSVAFEIVPDSYVRNRYDALLSDKLVKYEKILVIGPDYQDDEKARGSMVDRDMAPGLCRRCSAIRA